jgi:NADH-quinone oxidoreductase subunit A
MLEAYYPVAILIGITAALGVLVTVLGHLFGPRRPTKRKGETYESGMMPYGPGTRQMPIRFYLVAVLFILFDVEVIFLFPWAVVYRELGLFGIIEMVIFVLILLVGFIYALKKGAFEWE